MKPLVMPGNDPACPRAWNPVHICVDAHGWPVAGTTKCRWTSARSDVLEQARGRSA